MKYHYFVVDYVDERKKPTIHTLQAGTHFSPPPSASHVSGPYTQRTQAERVVRVPLPPTYWPKHIRESALMYLRIMVSTTTFPFTTWYEMPTQSCYAVGMGSDDPEHSANWEFEFWGE